MIDTGQSLEEYLEMKLKKIGAGNAMRAGHPSRRGKPLHYVLFPFTTTILGVLPAIDYESL
ncbi:hypothetical protein A3742_15790 [Oleiphilus sp. HI0071]|jgi:hypothetical protein|nr:hypothetical protein A3737_20555 [Oleiphilus sp. HI0065]KZY64630.1 hypothetical protein A3737_13575 [Oleiphilus sp. HI0065]KZY78071.1 hypothetical protein A3742_23535 [Oleiphilus sp. HI0071]KZY88850.1 hypothetical protein A3742_15790 [Oleiphilus sp. HI0071]KZZ78048.1 hypothetical protein A3767_13945 [Oleiphilus sp. HI0133]